MKCDICQINDAVVFLQEVRGNQKKELAINALFGFSEPVLWPLILFNVVKGDIRNYCAENIYSLQKIFVINTKKGSFTSRKKYIDENIKDVAVVDKTTALKYFDFVGGATLDHTRVEKSDVLSYALDSVNADRGSAILVGDRVYDAEGARLCGIDSLGVTYGHGSEREIRESGFSFIAKTVGDITEILH